jgi:hypothetical protein
LNALIARRTPYWNWKLQYSRTGYELEPRFNGAGEIPELFFTSVQRHALLPFGVASAGWLLLPQFLGRELECSVSRMTASRQQRLFANRRLWNISLLSQTPQSWQSSDLRLILGAIA